jgi:hypothetical protein
MSNSESSLVRPTQPGTPWAPPQPLTQGSDPTVPTAPELNPVPEGLSDRIRPVDPTIPMALTDADSLLSVAAPEGMVRITLGDQSRFCFPCHMDGWQALGWTAHPPGLADGGSGEDGGESPPDPPVALPTITAIKGGPFVVKGEVVEAYVVGTGFSADGDLEVWGESQAEAGEYSFLGATELSFQLDCSLITEPTRLPVVAVNEAGRSELYLLAVVAAAAMDASVAAEVPDYAAMTKAQIIAEVERRYGVPLDPGMTKAELVAEAERLASGGLTAEAEPDSRGELPALPLDLLR